MFQSNNCLRSAVATYAAYVRCLSANYVKYGYACQRPKSLLAKSQTSDFSSVT